MLSVTPLLFVLIVYLDITLMEETLVTLAIVLCKVACSAKMPAHVQNAIMISTSTQEPMIVIVVQISFIASNVAPVLTVHNVPSASMLTMQTLANLAHQTVLPANQTQTVLPVV